jgi:hypothetical protein
MTYMIRDGFNIKNNSPRSPNCNSNKALQHWDCHPKKEGNLEGFLSSRNEMVKEHATPCVK